MWEFCWQTGQRVASARASRRASMSVIGMSSSAAGCPSQSRTGSCRRVMWRRTGLGSIMGPSLLADCGFSLPGDPLDRQPPDVTPPARAAAKTGWGGGATPVSGFVGFCLGQVPAPAGFPGIHPGIHPGITIKREVHPGAVGDPSPVAAGPELSVPLVRGVAGLPVSAFPPGHRRGGHQPLCGSSRRPGGAAGA